MLYTKDQSCNKEVFRAEKVPWNKGTLINISTTRHERKVPEGNTPAGIFSPRYSKQYFK